MPAVSCWLAPNGGLLLAANAHTGAVKPRCSQQTQSFVTAQFRRHREVLEKQLVKLKDSDAVAASLKRVPK